jgi:hypothetical protein
MWNQWKKRGQRHVATAQKPGRRLRAVSRLGFEAMEGRLMLSGDAPEFASWGAYSPEFRLANYPAASQPLQTAAAEYVEGGFIQPGAVLLGSSGYGMLDTITNRANVGQLPPATPVMVNYDLSDWSGTTYNFEDVHLDAPAIPLIEFPATDSDAETTFVDQVDIVGPQPTKVTVDEGGAIPINSILAFVGQTDSWRSGERLASKANLQPRDPSWRMPSVAQATQAREIAGEWARPMMLVTAGGEPTGIGRPEKHQYERTPAPDSDDQTFIRRRLSSGEAADTPENDSWTAGDFHGSRGSAAAVPSGDAAHASRRLSSTSERPRSLNLASHVAAADSLSGPTTSESTVREVLANRLASEINVRNESAYAQVYDELGTSEKLGAQDAFNREAWRDSWKATPLLVILALERIAASNSRRAKREASNIAVRPTSHGQNSSRGI